MTTTPDRTEPRRHLDQPQPLSFQTDPDRGPVTASYAKALILAVLAERPDWTFHDVAAALDDCRGEQVRDLRRAVFAVADRPGSTPDEIASVGPHWNAVPIPAPEPAPVPVRTDPENCPKHPYRKRTDCDDEQCATGKGRGPGFWERFHAAKKTADDERERVKAEREAALAAALAEDRDRLSRLGTPEPRHV